jgi:hypothetical protein
VILHYPNYVQSSDAYAKWGSSAACNRGKRGLPRGKRPAATTDEATTSAPVDRIEPAIQRRESTSMEFFSGLDVSIDETAVCVVDDKGKVHVQTATATDPEAIVQ